jgi:glycosyltransferase involved in cell wall biosynthesis
MNRNVSIIIIARNEPLIRYALKSLEYQKVKPYEIIVVVDSLDDMSAKIANEFADKLPVRVVVNDIKPGYGGARRKGVEAARGSILAFIDADVLVPPWWLSRVIEDLKQCFVVTGPEIPLKRSEVHGTVDALPKMRMPPNCKYSYTWFAPTQNLALQRSVFEIVGNFDEKFDIGGEDYDFCLRLKKAGISIFHDSCVYVFHVEHKHRLKKAWRDGKARARAFLKHGIHAIRDAFVCLFHGLALLSSPLLVTLSVVSSNMLLLVPIALSLAHRSHRTFVAKRRANVSLWQAIKNSLITYISYTAFVIELFRRLFR